MSKNGWETERALLGGLLLDPSQLLEVAERITAEAFSRPPHECLFRLMIELQEREVRADIVTIIDEIGRRQAEDYDGIAYVAALPNACPSVENLVTYAERVREASVRRRLVDAASHIVEVVKNEPKDLPTLLDEAERAIFDISQLSGRSDWHPISEVLDDQFREIQERAKAPGAVTGVSTGFYDLDKKLAGFHKGTLVILAARPAMGKTALALNMALTAAEHGPVGIFSLEMSRQELATRMLCAKSEVDAGKVRTGMLDAADWRRLTQGVEDLHAMPIEIDDTPGLTISQLRSKARRLFTKRRGLSLVIVDYLQLMTGSGGMKESRENVISNISRGLKILSKELAVPVLALSQLNRGVEARTDKRPLPSDLRESGAIEQDADVIMFIYRDEFYNKESQDKGLAEVIIAKQRAGDIGTVKLVFDGKYTLFRNYADPSKMPGGYA
ncbi:replicative DNA helicase [Deltaproteobacteria bacterium]|nr:replicative DNA helicase [Deltaproteobacteria bacterium]